MYKKILCPIDGSKVSLRGAREATRLAAALSAELRFLYVLDNTAFLLFPPAVEDFIAFARKDGEKILARAQQNARRGGVEAEVELREIREGRVAPVIVSAAKKYRAGLLVMGTHGRRGLSGLLLGSDATAVIAAAAMPVVLVR